MVDRFLSSQRF